MAAPTLSDGISRAIKVIAVPSIGLILLVSGIRMAHGKQEAGIVYIGISALILAGIYTSAKYWNAKYTIGFAVTGLLIWFGVPGVFSHLVPTLYADIGSIVVLLFIILIGLLVIDKW